MYNQTSYLEPFHFEGTFWYGVRFNVEHQCFYFHLITKYFTYNYLYVFLSSEKED